MTFGSSSRSLSLLRLSVYVVCVLLRSTPQMRRSPMPMVIWSVLALLLQVMAFVRHRNRAMVPSGPSGIFVHWMSRYLAVPPAVPMVTPRKPAVRLLLTGRGIIGSE